MSIWHFGVTHLVLDFLVLVGEFGRGGTGFRCECWPHFSISASGRWATVVIRGTRAVGYCPTRFQFANCEHRTARIRTADGQGEIGIIFSVDVKCAEIQQSAGDNGR